VVGLGALGAFTLRELARRGVRTLGIDRHHPPHTHGSSHGRTRIIRSAYFENPLYVPLVREAWSDWLELEREARVELLRCTGALMVGAGDGEVIRGTLASAQLHGIPNRVVSARELRKEVPRLRIPRDHLAVFEKEAGVLFPERAIEAALRSARAAGARIRTGTELQGWVADEDGVTLTVGGEVIRARNAVLAAGPWMPDVVAMGGSGLPRPLEVERQVSFWFETQALPPLDGGTLHRSPELISPDPDGLPVVLWEFEPGRYVYLVPDLGQGLKAAIHHEGEIGHPDELSRETTAQERQAVRSLLNRLIPGVTGDCSRASVCLYTNTPDRHFLVGAHPSFRRVFLVGGGSGHAFKFAPALGRRVADLMEGKPVALPRRTAEGKGSDPFAPHRLAK
jgi:sarcosine oxidase